jgi:uroporphyrinogen-III synthase
MATEFYEVTEETVDDVINLVDVVGERTGEELKAYFLEQVRLPENADTTLVVFKDDDVWRIMFIGNELNVPEIIEQMDLKRAEAARSTQANVEGK